MKQIDDFMAEALAYSKEATPAKKNLKMEAMRAVMTGDKTLYIHTNLAKSITGAVLMAKKYGVKMVIVGGRDAWMVTDILKDNKIPVILGPTQSTPAYTDTDIDQPYKTPAMLAAAGVEFCLSMGGSWRIRNLNFQAGPGSELWPGLRGGRTRP